MTDCPECKHPVPHHLRECPSCGADCGFPNVRLALQPQEVEELARRIRDAEVSATARNCKAQLDEFGEAVSSAQAVISRPLSVINSIISENQTYVSHQQMMNAGAKMPADDEFDRTRLQFENALFPNFSEKIIFAALSLSGTGMSGYGAFSVVLREEMISKRATVFEENPHTFSKKHKVLLNQPLPSGYRATWLRRGDLAKAKLVSKIDKNTKDADFSCVLTKDDGTTGGGDFIEVHIYGSINKYAILSINGPKSMIKADRIILDALKQKLIDLAAAA